MKTLSAFVVLLAVPLLTPPPLAAQASLTGTWTLQASAFLPDIKTPCQYQGTLELSPTDGGWIGPATLSFVSGPEGCPAELTAQCTANLDGGTVTGTLDGGDAFGMATFTGTLTGAAITGTLGDGAPQADKKAPVTPKASPGGTFNTDSGPFMGVGGTWLAARLSVLAIPTLTESGLILLTLLLLASASLLLMRGGGTS